MFKLSNDILSIVFEEFLYDYNTLFSCLLVNRFWCETVIPILWKNPWRNQMKEHHKKSLFNTIVSFLSEESREFLASQGIELTYQKPSFDYINP